MLTLFIDFGCINFLTGSLTKKSKNRGVKLEELKLPPVVDFASGMHYPVNNFHFAPQRSYY